MFTGIIEEVGHIEQVEQTSAGGKRIIVKAPQAAAELKKGHSVAVSGVCLTATSIEDDGFAADLAAETVTRTSLARLSPGALVNLELPMRAGARMGGHIVQGHVDGVGELLAFDPLPTGDYRLRARIPRELVKYVVFKGSISIEGISLTVASIEGDQVEIAIIPHTYQATNLCSLRPGDPLNLEADVLAKYAEKMLQGEAGSQVTIERLVAEGF